MSDEQLGSWEDGLLLDGFKQPFYIEASPGQYPALRGVFTPMLPELVDETDAKIEKGEAKKAVPTAAEAMAPLLHSWSFGPDKPTAQHLRRMRWAQFNKLYRIVTGKSPSDTDPLAKKPEEEPETPLEAMGKS